MFLSICIVKWIRSGDYDPINLAPSEDLRRFDMKLKADIEQQMYNLDKNFVQGTELPISKLDISSKNDFPFQEGCREIPETRQEKANAGFVVLAKNSDIHDVVKSMISLERHFNQWYDYPWVFLNDEPFSDKFKSTVSKYTNGQIEFGEIAKEDWEFPSNVNSKEFNEYINGQGDRGILYGNSPSYHKMCRFYSGAFFKHPLVQKLDWYWRVEPDVEFFCDITYDPFVEMEKSGKKYGFNIMIMELYYTIPNLFKQTMSYINKNKITPGSAWDLFLKDPIYVESKEFKYNAFDFDELKTKGEILQKLEEIHVQKHLLDSIKSDEDIKTFDEHRLISNLIKQSVEKHRLYEDRINRKEYNLAHFWSNFEIARTDLFNSTTYQKYYDHLEQSGGFYKERWGDAPIHSLAVGMMLDLNEIHYFRDIGYRHSNIVHCPANSQKNRKKYVADKKFRGNSNDMTKLEKKMYDESYWSKPDKPRANGVGCRCRCPDGYDESEDAPGSFIRDYARISGDHYDKFLTIDLDEMGKLVEKRLQNYLETGGVLGAESVIGDLVKLKYW